MIAGYYPMQQPNGKNSINILFNIDNMNGNGIGMLFQRSQ
jgi:hypothetical protein